MANNCCQLPKEACRLALEKIFGQPFGSARPLWLTDSGDRLELDSYNKEIGLAVVYNAKHHYELIGTLRVSETKRSLCADNGVALIVVPYTVSINQIRDYILSRVPPYLQSLISG